MYTPHHHGTSLPARALAHILTTPMARKVLTNWYLLTGTTCSGKTTVAQQLEDRGLLVAPEVTRAVFDAFLGHGVARIVLAQREPRLRRIISVLVRRLHNELLPACEDLLVFDRGLPDQIVFSELAGLPTRHLRSYAARVRYKEVFLFEPLPFVPDGVRTVDAARRQRLDSAIRRTTGELGYTPTFVPAMSSERRTSLILTSCVNLPAPRAARQLAAIADLTAQIAALTPGHLDDRPSSSTTHLAGAMSSRSSRSE